MRNKRILCALLLAALLLGMPVQALAAKKATIKFPAKVGLMTEGTSVTLKPKLSRVKLSQLSWSSSDESVASLDGNVLTGVNPGKAVITASGGGAKASFGVVVLPARLSLAVGEKTALPYGGVEKYAVRDRKVAKVGKKGDVQGVGAGSTEIQVKYGSQKRVIPVTVTAVDTEEDGKVAGLDCASEADQIVLVEYTGGSGAELSVHEKEDGVWRQLFTCGAYVGKNGIDKAEEGDGRTPTGTYNLTTPFGIKSNPGAVMPYTKVTKYHYWCADPNSKYYNQLVDEREVDRKHTKKDEYLIKYKGSYNYCLFIDYNAAGVPNRGSCIFLHCAGSKKYTSGCVAIPENVMKKIVCWARSGAKIVIKRQA